MILFRNVKKPLLLLFVAMVSFITSCKSDKNTYIHLRGEAQGTTFSIKYESENQTDYSGEIDSLFQVINMSMSTYHSESIISKSNAGDSLVVLDEHFIKVFNQSLQVFNETNGAFDPTVGILVNAYGFGPSKVEQLDESKIDSLRQFVGLKKIGIKDAKLTKENKGITLDFNAIAQGYTVDVMADFLKSMNISNFMIEIGGEVKAQGVNPNGKDWSIGIQNPESELNMTDEKNSKKSDKSIESVLHLKNKSLATSGNYRKFKIDANGRKFVHTINPLTGKSEPNNLLSATVLTSKDCAFADAYATSLMVMGYEKSLEFLKKHPELEVFLVYVDEKGTTQTYSNIKK